MATSRTTRSTFSVSVSEPGRRCGKVCLPAHGFLPAASPKALTSISRTIRRWTLHHRSDKSLQDLAEMYNPYIRGWINYYGHFYRTQLRSTLKRIDVYLIRWARRKFKRLRERPKAREIGLIGFAVPIQTSSRFRWERVLLNSHRSPGIRPKVRQTLSFDFDPCFCSGVVNIESDRHWLNYCYLLGPVGERGSLIRNEDARFRRVIWVDQ